MSAMPVWQLSTREFRLLWDGEGGAPYPSSLLWSIKDDPGHEIDKRHRIAELQRGLTSGQREAFSALTHPTYALFVVGIDARKDLDDPSHHLRTYAAWSGGEFGYVVRQDIQGNSAWGGPVSITRHETASWTRAVVALLPPPTAAGRAPVDTDVKFERMIAGGETLIATVVSPAGSAGGQFRNDVTPGTCGTITVQIGSVSDGYPPTRVETRYRDIPDDGRYLLIIDEPGSAMGVDNAGLTKMINRVINATRKRHQQRSAS